VGTRGYILKKVFQAFLTLLAVIVFNFFLFRILPADPVDILTRGAGAKLDEAEKAELRASYGLDKPLFPGQFLDFMGDTLRGDLGQSIIQRPGEDVTAIFGEFMWPTLLLVGVSTIISTVLGIFMGIYAGWKRNGKFDLFSMGFSLVLYSMPEFWLGMLLILAALVPLLLGLLVAMPVLFGSLYASYQAIFAVWADDNASAGDNVVLLHPSDDSGR